LSEDAVASRAAINFFGETGPPWHCEEVQPERREIPALIS